MAPSSNLTLYTSRELLMRTNKANLDPDEQAGTCPASVDRAKQSQFVPVCPEMGAGGQDWRESLPRKDAKQTQFPERGERW